MLEIVLNEDLWFPVGASVSIVVAVGYVIRQRTQGLTGRTKIIGGMNLFYGLLIGILGSGHLLAVAIKTSMGTLPLGSDLWFLVVLGLAIAVPGIWLVATVGTLVRNDAIGRRRTMVLNALLGAVLIVPAAPLALFAVLNLIILAAKKAD